MLDTSIKINLMAKPPKKPRRNPIAAAWRAWRAGK